MEAFRINTKAVNRGISNESGQGLLEYVLLLTIIASAFLAVMNGLDRLRVTQKLMQPITKDFAKTYQFGSPKVTGFENGETPSYHPRWYAADNFRIFIWPFKAD